jgi:hypothetical protein
MAGGSSVRVVVAAFACNGVIAVSKFVGGRRRQPSLAAARPEARGPSR